jgi:hypothetical protein
MKSTRLDASRRRIHIWHDGPLNFHAEAVKFDGEWFVECGPLFMVFDEYQAVTDWVLDRHRLAKAGLDSWEGPAIIHAAMDGHDWASLSDDQRQNYMDIASATARRQEEALR